MQRCLKVMRAVPEKYINKFLGFIYIFFKSLLIKIYFFVIFFKIFNDFKPVVVHWLIYTYLQGLIPPDHTSVWPAKKYIIDLKIKT